MPPIPPDSVPAGIYDDTNVVVNPSQMTGRMPRNIVELAFRRGASQAERQAAVDLVHGVVVGGLRYFADGDGVYLVRVPTNADAQGLFAAIRRLESLSIVEFVSPHLVGDRMVLPR